MNFMLDLDEPTNPNKKTIGRESSKSLGFMINTFVDLVYMVYEYFLKESYDLCCWNKDQEEVGEEPPR